MVLLYSRRTALLLLLIKCGGEVQFSALLIFAVVGCSSANSSKVNNARRFHTIAQVWRTALTVLCGVDNLNVKKSRLRVTTARGGVSRVPVTET